MNAAVADKRTLIALLKNNRERLHAYGVGSIGLFGSFVRDEDMKKESDVDFKSGQKTYRNFMQPACFLEGLLGRKVEWVARKSLSPCIGPYILDAVEDVGVLENW